MDRVIMTAQTDIETFVLDDDLDDLELLQSQVIKMGLTKIFLFARIKELIEKLNPNVRVVAIDIRLNDLEDVIDDEGNVLSNGAQVIKYVRRKNPGCYVIVVSGQVNEEIFIELINNQVDWFIKKKLGYLDELINQIQIGKEKVCLRDAILQHAMQSTARIENRRKLKENDAGALV